MKIFALKHSRGSNIENETCLLIGCFYTYSEAQEVLEQCRNKPGFIDFPDGFMITVYQMDSIFNAITEEVLAPISQMKLENDMSYALYYEYENEDSSRMLGVFSSEKKAKKAKELLSDVYDLDRLPGCLEIYDRVIGMRGWMEGFRME